MLKTWKLAIFIILGYTGFILLASTALVSNDPPQKADYIIVVSGGDTLGRTKKGVELYKQAYAPKLLLSGDAADPDSPSNAEVMGNYARNNGVPEEDILLEDRSKNTKENARESIGKIIKSGPKQTVILVTSPYHSRRAKKEFEDAFKKQTIQAKVISVNAEDKHWGKMWWIRPRGILTALFELVKLPSAYI